MTPFCFEHTFSAPSIDSLIAAYFDPELQARVDHTLDITEREITELEDTGDVLRRVCRVVPKRQLPAILRPFASGPLHYQETVTWRRPQSMLAIKIEPSLLRGRARIDATYRLEPRGPGRVYRRYAGQVSVDVALVANRVETGIVAEFARSVPVTAACTQAWLDRHTPLTIPSAMA